MKVTNKLNLPAPLYKAICNDSYSPGESDYTATGLIEPARIGALKKLHAEELTEDASDRIYSLQGQSVHTILERAAKDLQSEGYLAEARFYCIIDGKTVGAQIDVLHPKSVLLQDYKVTSVYKVKDGITEEFAKQVNIQKYLIENGWYHPKNEDGIEDTDVKLYVKDTIKKMEIVAILRDWSKGKRKEEVAIFGERANYPAHQVIILDVPIIPNEEILVFIKSRIEQHEIARNVQLPLCTTEERWATPDKWAVMKEGQKRAKSLHNSEEAAILVASEDSSLQVVRRPGASRRCESYCSVRAFCTQYKALKGEK